jgi:CubicO group peptidase (beta-lactamase class C family)
VDGPYHQACVSDGMDQPGLSMEENLRRIASVPLSYEPGTACGYSVATDVLGEVVARAAEVSLPEAVRKLVTQPLGMRDTDFGLRDPAALAVPYADGNPEPVRMGDPQLVKFEPGAGILFSPSRVFDSRSVPSGGADDYLVLLETLRTGGGAVLREETVRTMRSNQISW